MQRLKITRRFIFASVSFISFIYLIRLCIRAYGDIVYYDYGTVAGFISDILSFFGTVFLPSLIILVVIFYFYIKPLDLVINDLKAGRPVPEKRIGKARLIIQQFPIYIVCLNILIYFGGQLATILGNGLLGSLLQPQELAWLVFIIASASLYSFGQITITNQIFAEARILLNIYHVDKKKKSLVSLRARTVLLFAILFVYTFSFLTRYIVIYMDKEMFYSNQLEAISSNDENPAAAETAYKEHLAAMINPGADPTEMSDKIVFPYNTRTNRVPGYTIFFLVSFACLFLIGFIIVFLFSRELTLQIRTQHSTIRDILSGRENLSKQISIVQYDEVGNVSDMINTLMTKLKDILLQIRDSSGTIGSSSESLNDKLLDTTSAIEQMIASVTRITGNVTSQVNIVENTKQKLETMLENIDVITMNIESEVSFIEETATAMQEMARSITSVNDSTTKAQVLSERLLDISRAGDISVRDTIDAIKKSKDSTDRVLEIVEMISSISSETNILALNAAIEASHAGAYGRGFSVIASEVRKLSEKSAKQANEISTYIHEMAGRVTHGVAMSEQAGLAFAKIDTDIRSTSTLINQISGAMNEQKDGTREILNAVDSVVKASSEVRTIAVDLKTQSQTIRDHMNELYQVSTQIDHATREQKHGNDEILSLVGNVKEVSVRNIDTVNKLKTIVESFNIDSNRKDGSL